MGIISGIPDVIRLLIILSILVVVHEWGHFIMARTFKIGVEDFSIGFGKRLIRLGKRGDTEFNIRALPLGGFVKIQGMEADEEPINMVRESLARKSADKDPDSRELPLVAENRDTARRSADPDGFNARPLWQRSLVILGGPVMSFVFGWLLLMLMGCTVGVATGKFTNRVYQVMPGGAGQKIGLESGDVIEAIDGQKIADGAALIDTIHHSLGKPLQITIDHNGHVSTKTATPTALPDENGKPLQLLDVDSPESLAALGLKPGDTLAGIEGVQDVAISTQADLDKALRDNVNKKVTLDVTRKGEDLSLKGVLPASVLTAPPTVHSWTVAGLYFEPSSTIERVSFRKSISLGNLALTNIFKGLWHLLEIHKLHQNAGGIVRMYQQTHIAAKAGLGELISLAAQISISLAIFNMLPIPVLDGGHLLSFFVEWVRHGKKMTVQQQNAFLMFGLAVIGVLFILINGHDIIQEITHQMPQ